MKNLKYIVVHLEVRIKMGLFSHKKKEQKPENLPPLKFPELPSISSKDSDRPMMREASAIKQAVSPSASMPMVQPMQPVHREMQHEPSGKPSEHPLFVKVDTYREVVDTLSVIKSKLADASHTLNELIHLKEEEDKELNAWHSDLEAIKEKLMTVDQKLFEQ